jgi:hypothetical protein
MTSPPQFGQLFPSRSPSSFTLPFCCNNSPQSVHLAVSIAVIKKQFPIVYIKKPLYKLLGGFVASDPLFFCFLGYSRGSFWKNVHIFRRKIFILQADVNLIEEG